MRFLVDAQLPPALARPLVELGHEAQHVGDFSLLRAPDREIWNRASELEAILMTKGADFVTLRALRGSGPSIVWIRIGNTTRRVLLKRIQLALPEIVEAIRRGEQIVVVD